MRTGSAAALLNWRRVIPASCWSLSGSASDLESRKRRSISCVKPRKWRLDGAQIPYSAAVSYYFEHRYAKSRRSLDKALKLDPKSSKAFFLYAGTLVNEGRNHDAEMYFRRAIAVEPSNARFRLHLGTALLRNKQRGEVRHSFEDALGLNSHYGLAHYELGKVRLQANELKSAREELEAAVRTSRIWRRRITNCHEFAQH